MLTAILVRAIGSTASKKLILVVLKALVKRTDNTIDDALVALISEVMDGDVSSIKKSKLKKK